MHVSSILLVIFTFKQIIYQVFATCVPSHVKEETILNLIKSEDETLEQLFDAFQKSRIRLRWLPSGLSSYDEGTFLGVMAAKTIRHVLEIGPFSGRSTVGIAHGMCVSTNHTKMHIHRQFATIDLFPQSADAYKAGEFTLRNHFQYSNDGQSVEFCVDVLGCVPGMTIEHYQNNYKPVYERSGGQLHTIMGRLNHAGLTDFAIVCAGTVAPSLQYSMIFADTAHSIEEFQKMWVQIKLHIQHHLRHSTNFWLALHDQQASTNCCTENVYHGSDPTYATGYGRHTGDNIPPNIPPGAEIALKEGTCCNQRDEILRIIRSTYTIKFWKQIDSLLVMDLKLL